MHLFDYTLTVLYHIYHYLGKLVHYKIRDNFVLVLIKVRVVGRYHRGGK